MKYFKRAYSYQMKGDLEKAILNYLRSIEIEPTAEAYTFLGWAYSFQGRLHEAISQCQQAISLDPEFGNPYNDIGAYYLQMGKTDEAIEWLQKAKQARRYENPEFAYCNLARVYELKALWPLALEEYKQALHIRPGYSPAVDGLGRLNAHLN